MNNLKYVRFEKLSLKNNAEYNEKWLQQRIKENPSILGLGDLILKDEERIQPRAGRRGGIPMTFVKKQVVS